MLPSYIRKIKCPRHYILKPGGVPFVMERIPSLRGISDKAAGKFNAGLMERGAAPVKLWRPKKDKFGNKIQNFKDYIQPEVSPTEVRMRIYDPFNNICNQCRRCVTA